MTAVPGTAPSSAATRVAVMDLDWTDADTTEVCTYRSPPSRPRALSPLPALPVVPVWRSALAALLLS